MPRVSFKDRVRSLFRSQKRSLSLEPSARGRNHQSSSKQDEEDSPSTSFDHLQPSTSKAVNGRFTEDARNANYTRKMAKLAAGGSLSSQWRNGTPLSPLGRFYQTYIALNERKSSRNESSGKAVKHLLCQVHSLDSISRSLINLDCKPEMIKEEQLVLKELETTRNCTMDSSEVTLKDPSEKQYLIRECTTDSQNYFVVSKTEYENTKQETEEKCSHVNTDVENLIVCSQEEASQLIIVAEKAEIQSGNTRLKFNIMLEKVHIKLQENLHPHVSKTRGLMMSEKSSSSRDSLNIPEEPTHILRQPKETLQNEVINIPINITGEKVYINIGAPFHRLPLEDQNRPVPPSLQAQVGSEPLPRGNQRLQPLPPDLLDCATQKGLQTHAGSQTLPPTIILRPLPPDVQDRDTQPILLAHVGSQTQPRSRSLQPLPPDVEDRATQPSLPAHVGSQTQPRSRSLQPLPLDVQNRAAQKGLHTQAGSQTLPIIRDLWPLPASVQAHVGSQTRPRLGRLQPLPLDKASGQPSELHDYGNTTVTLPVISPNSSHRLLEPDHFQSSLSETAAEPADVPGVKVMSDHELSIKAVHNGEGQTIINDEKLASETSLKLSSALLLSAFVQRSEYHEQELPTPGSDARDMNLMKPSEQGFPVATNYVMVSDTITNQSSKSFLGDSPSFGTPLETSEQDTSSGHSDRPTDPSRDEAGQDKHTASEKVAEEAVAVAGGQALVQNTGSNRQEGFHQPSSPETSGPANKGRQAHLIEHSESEMTDHLESEQNELITTVEGGQVLQDAENTQEDDKISDDMGMVDVFTLIQKVHSENYLLQKHISKYKSRTEKVARLQKYLEQLKAETEEMKRLLVGVDKQTAALRNEAAEMRCTVTAVCDMTVAAIGKETEARRLEPVCYRRYLNIRTPTDASNVLVAIRNRIKALNDLEVLVYRKQLVLHHVLPSVVQEKVPPPKRVNRVAHKGGQKHKNNESSAAGQLTTGNIIIEVVSPKVGQGTPSCSEEISHTESPTISTPVSVSNDAVTSVHQLPDTEV